MTGREVMSDGAQKEGQGQKVMTERELKELQDIARNMRSAYLQFCHFLRKLGLPY
jgi:hypothetical protein